MILKAGSAIPLNLQLCKNINGLPFHPIPWLLIGMRMLTGLGVHGPLDEWVKQCVGPPFTKSLSSRTWLQKTMVYDTYNLKLVTYNYIVFKVKLNQRRELRGPHWRWPKLSNAQLGGKLCFWQIAEFANGSRTSVHIVYGLSEWHCCLMMSHRYVFFCEINQEVVNWIAGYSWCSLDTYIYMYIIFIILFIHMYILYVYRLYLKKHRYIYIYICNVHSMLSSMFLDCILYTIIAYYNNL